jgi:uroporphyrinogen decarboxylase
MTGPGNRKERLLSAVAGRPLDRPPVSFWGHCYHRESTAEDLAAATLEFRDRYDWDFVKLNPRASYHGEVWGLAMRYSGVPGEKPARASFPVRAVGDWRAVDERGLDAAPLAEQLEAIRLVRRGLPRDVLLLQTVFSPLAITAYLADGPRAVLEHLRQDEALVLAALRRIAATFARYTRAALEAGADGLFFATVDWATRDLLTPDEYARLARPTDLEVLGAAAGAALNLVHVCRPRNLLRELADYPAHGFSWDATDPTNPTLQEGLGWFAGAAVGGIGFGSKLLDPSPDGAVAQFRAGLEATGGRRWIVAPGCSIPPATRPETLDALRTAVESGVPTGG